MTFAIKAASRVRGGRAGAIDGAHVIDFKPVLEGLAPQGDVREPAWAVEIMETDW